MLRRRGSLALRAGMIFISIYLATFFAGLALLQASALSSDDGNHLGPDIALAFAAAELEKGKGRLNRTPGGGLEALARTNPGLWIVGRLNGQEISTGSVPVAARALFDRNQESIELGEYRVPGVARPLADMSMERIEVAGQAAVVAAGGVHPETISFATAIRYFLDEGLFVIALFVVGVGLVAMLLAVPLVSAAVRPVAVAAAQIRPDEPSRRLPEDAAPRELLPVVRAFNAALERLANELVRRKRLIADLAHELRTPLAIMSLRLEVLPESETKADLQRVSLRLSHLVGQMLDVERLALAGRRNELLDLVTLAREAVADIAPMAMAAGYEVSVAAPNHPVLVNGDSHSLSRAIGNLLANSVAHGGGKGQIALTVGQWRTLDVADEGPGVASSIQHSLFEPFCRERWDRDGCGLGLHLAREVMRAHGGDATLLPTAKGAAFRLEFPKPEHHAA